MIVSSMKLQAENRVKSQTNLVKAVSSRKLKRLFANYKPEIEFVLSVDRDRSVYVLERLLDTGMFTVDEFAQELKNPPIR